MNRPSRIPLPLAAALLAGVVLSACGSGGGGMSDEDKIKLMDKAHDAPLGSGKGASTPAPAAGGATNPLAHP